jgi:hypothetical protein
MLTALATGFMAAALSQPEGGWWLDSGRGVMVTLMSSFLAAALFEGLRPGDRDCEVAPLWLGTMTGLAACLWSFGPSTIWPIVLVVSAVLTAASVVTGSLFGVLCRSV